jgi:hypothetical protein
MHRKIILKAFEKARKEEVKGTGIVPSIAKSAERLSDFISEDGSGPFGEKSLRNLYNSSAKEDGEDIQIKQPQVVNALCKYVGFDDYEAFLISNEVLVPQELVNNSTRFTHIQKVFLGVIIGLVMVISLIFYVNRQRWMIWEENHYVVAPFDAEKVQNGILKLYKEERIANFKRVKPACNYVFFNEDRSVKIWYGKNTNGALEYFTDLGKHPKTGKTLKAITSYMIRTHICDTY